MAAGRTKPESFLKAAIPSGADQRKFPASCPLLHLTKAEFSAVSKVENNQYIFITPINRNPCQNNKKIYYNPHNPLIKQ
jgi:hypothetical protein